MEGMKGGKEEIKEGKEKEKIMEGEMKAGDGRRHERNLKKRRK